MLATEKDRIFDGLSGRFQHKIYDDPRGSIRLNILQDDLAPLVTPKEPTSTPLRILDAGGGLGQMSIWLARQGHRVTLVEPSEEMLQRAETDIRRAGLEDSIYLVRASVQDFAANGCGPFDLITFHAVMEWLAEPRKVLEQLLECLRPGGWLSLMFFNYHSSVMRHLIGGDLEAVKRNAIAGNRHAGITPISPLKPEAVRTWLDELELVVETWSGIRCFYDYMHPTIRKKADLEEVLPLERTYSQQEPFRSMARYQHMLCWKQ